METVPTQDVSDKPGEFIASGGSPPGVTPAIALIEEELAEILADALAADVQQFRTLEAIQTVAAPTASSPRGSASRQVPTRNRGVTSRGRIAAASGTVSS